MTIARALALAVVLLASPVVTPVDAQDAKPAEPKGVTTKGLVTSLGALQRHGQRSHRSHGRHRRRWRPAARPGASSSAVPTYIYVIDGVLTTDYEAGPVGIKGAQYHAAGQSFMDNGGMVAQSRESHRQAGEVPDLHIGYPGHPAPSRSPKPNRPPRSRHRPGPAGRRRGRSPASVVTCRRRP